MGGPRDERIKKTSSASQSQRPGAGTTPWSARASGGLRVLETCWVGDYVRSIVAAEHLETSKGHGHRRCLCLPPAIRPV